MFTESIRQKQLKQESMKTIEGFSNYSINQSGEVVTANGEKKVVAKNGKVALTDDHGTKHYVSLSDIAGVNLACYGDAGIQPEPKVTIENPAKVKKEKVEPAVVKAAKDAEKAAKAEAKAIEDAAKKEAKAIADAEKKAAKELAASAKKSDSGEVKTPNRYMILMDVLKATDGLTKEEAIAAVEARFQGTQNVKQGISHALSGNVPHLNNERKNCNIQFTEVEGVRRFFIKA